MESTQQDYCRTELGVGEHGKNETRLNAERHQEFQNHLTESSQSIPANWDKEMKESQKVKSQMSSSSAACIGWSQCDDYTERKRLLNLERRAEYEAHLALKSKQKEDMRNDRRQEQSRRDEEDEADRKWSESHVVLSESDVRHQNQQYYSQELDNQIVEKRRLGVERMTMEEDSRNAQQEARDARYEKKLQKEQDDVDEAAQLKANGKEVLSESDVRHQKQQNYRQELDDQIEEKRRIGRQRTKNEEEAQYERHRAQEVRNEIQQRKESSEQDEADGPPTEANDDPSESDIRHQKQQEYAEQLRSQIEEKKRLEAAKKLKEKQQDEAYNESWLR